MAGLVVNRVSVGWWQTLAALAVAIACGAGWACKGAGDQRPNPTSAEAEPASGGGQPTASERPTQVPTDPQTTLGPGAQPNAILPPAAPGPNGAAPVPGADGGRGPEVGGSPGDAPAEVAEPAADSDCFATCVRDNQMRAVAPEQIEADCRAECSP